MHDEVGIAKAEFRGAEPGPRLLITGGVHGDEFEPMVAVRRLIERFRRSGLAGEDETGTAGRGAVRLKPDLHGASGAQVGRTGRRLEQLKKGTLTLVPVVNEAAFCNASRTAEDGLDLARVCPGKRDGSITERTAHALSELIRAADHYIDLHSGGTAFSVLPMTGYTLHADPRVLKRQREMARAFNLPIVWGTAPTLDGRSLSVARDAGVPAIYAEYRGSGLCDADGVAAYEAGCLNVMRLLGMIEGDVPACRVEQMVEDARADSGHMQVCNPSPVTGFFEPAVELGQHVQAGALIGTVADALGTTLHEIRADQSGQMLVLRTFSRVLEGESVGVVLEANGGHDANE